MLCCLEKNAPEERIPRTLGHVQRPCEVLPKDTSPLPSAGHGSEGGRAEAWSCNPVPKPLVATGYQTFCPNCHHIHVAQMVKPNTVCLRPSEKRCRVRDPKILAFGLDRCGSVGWALSHKLKGPWFNSLVQFPGSIHDQGTCLRCSQVPGWGVREVTDQCFSCPPMFPSLPVSLLLSLKINKVTKGRKQACSWLWLRSSVG